MRERHDYVALEWVKGEIGETLSQARQALESFVQNPAESSALAQCRAYVHQVHGTLQMVEFYGAALLAEEMEQLAAALNEGRTANQREALEVLMQAILQLPAYLDLVQEARRDRPLVVLPLLNDLRAARGESLLSETSLFSPDLSSLPGLADPATLARLQGDQADQLLRKLRQMFQVGLVGFIRQQDPATHLGYLERVFARLEHLCQNAPLEPLWSTAAALVEGLGNGGVNSSASTRTLLRQLDAELKRLIEHGSAAAASTAPYDLTKNLLYYIAKSPVSSPRILQQKTRYRLDEALPDAGAVKAERARLAGPDRDAMRSVITALCEELVRVKDSLDLFVRGNRQAHGDLESLLVPLKQIADTLAVLGFAPQRKVVVDQYEALQAMLRGERDVDDNNLMDVAGALIYVESSLTGSVADSDSRQEAELMPTTSVNQVHRLVIKEARKGLEQAKDAIIEFIVSQWNHDHLEQVPPLLHQVRGGLAMIPLMRSSNLLDACARYIDEQMLAQRAVPDWQRLDTLADAITSVEYYLERLDEDPDGEDESILDVAEDSLRSLGYFPEADQQPVPEMAETPPSDTDADDQLSATGEVDEALADEQLLAEVPGEIEDALIDEADSHASPAEEPVAEEPATDPWDMAQDDGPSEVSSIEAIEAIELQPSSTDEGSDEPPAGSDEDWILSQSELEALELDTAADDSLDTVDFQALDYTLLPDTADASHPADDVDPQDSAASEAELAKVLATTVQPINPPARDIPPSLLPPPADEEPVDEELREVFIEEAEEVLETIREYLPQWKADAGNRMALTEIRRAFHTLKGSGRMVRALIIGELGWSIENLLNRVIDESVSVDSAVLGIVDDVVGVMPALVEEFAADAQRQRDDVDQMAATAHALASGRPLPEPVAPMASNDASPADEMAADDEPQGAVAESAELDPILIDIFRHEAEAHLEAVRRFVDACRDELPQPVDDSLQRALHTLKGSASMAGLIPIAELATPLERLVKEYKANGLPMDLSDTELLEDALGLLGFALERLDDAPLEPLPGADDLGNRLAARLQARLASLEAQDEDAPVSATRQLVGSFLIEGMDRLQSAERHLAEWRVQPDALQSAEALIHELESFAAGAELVDAAPAVTMAQALTRLFREMEGGRVATDEVSLDEGARGLECLVGMMDELAAGMQVQQHPQRLAAIEELLAGPDALMGDTQPVASEAEDDSLSVPPVAEVDNETWDLDVSGESWLQSPTPPQTPHEHGALLPPTSGASAAGLDDEIVSVFLEEAVDILESTGIELERWTADPGHLSALGSLQRDLHTLKGGARMAEVDGVAQLAHELESLYEGLVDRRYDVEPALCELLQRCQDRLLEQVETLQSGRMPADADDLVAQIRAYRDLPPDADLPESGAPFDPFFASPEPEIADRESPEPGERHAETSADASDSVPSEPDEEPAIDAALAAFIPEADALLERARESLQRWMAAPDNALEVEALQRDLHTLKGGARMADIAPVADLAHALESLYEALAAGRLAPSPELFSLLQECHDCLQSMLDGVRGLGSIPLAGPYIESIRVFRDRPDLQLAVPPSVALVPAAVVEVDEGDSEILEIFRDEAEDLLEHLETAIGSWEAEPAAAEPVEEMLRVLHTLKGGARLSGMTLLGNEAHALEQLLTEHENGDAGSDRILQMQQGYETLRGEVDGLRRRLDGLAPATSAAPATRSADIIPLHSTPVETPPAPTDAGPSLRLAPSVEVATAAPVVLPFLRRAAEAAQDAAARRGPQELVKVPAELLEGLVNLAGETSIFRGRVEQQVSDFSFTLSEMETTIERVRDQLRRLDTETQAQILSGFQSEAERAGYEDFDPLEMDRHSQLQQLSRALFESASDLLDLKETLSARNRDAETLLQQQARVNTELQEGLMRTRMVPFDRMVPRLRRIVRQVASELGKQVEFTVGNAEGEMDRTILERMIAPLEHMLRNAVDHGIESAPRRAEAGKTEAGNIRLTMTREAGDILMVLADDGRGIDLAAVRRKAVERGLMDEAADLSDHEVLQFILESGFSTADKITQISGRGVGMDVVHSEVKQLGGSMSIDSTPGEGTRFRIRLPFTVSVNRALMVHSGDDLYAVPLNTVEGIVRVSPYELEVFYAADAPRFEYAGQAYELKYLGELLNNGQQPKLMGQSLPLPVILVRSSEHAVAVQVDALAGSREIVVKSLGPQFAGVHGISGATILGDGRVVVILDLLATIRARHAHVGALPMQGPVRLVGAPEASGERPPLVMVVDDSVTVRKVTSRLLERNGMNVFTAKDGVDAISQLQERKPDIVLLDIEMPRMDGFEVATLIRHDAVMADLPIIMITSRSGEKHRDRAMAIGVNEYLGKPYQENDLLDSIQALIKRT